MAGQSESSLTQIADLEAELQEVQSLNARLEEDLLAAERTGSRMQRPGNGHDLDTSQSGFGSVLSGSQGEFCCNMLGLDLAPSVEARVTCSIGWCMMQLNSKLHELHACHLNCHLNLRSSPCGPQGHRSWLASLVDMLLCIPAWQRF